MRRKIRGNSAIELRYRARMLDRVSACFHQAKRLSGGVPRRGYAAILLLMEWIAEVREIHRKARTEIQLNRAG
jgi:hypothetical protein